jgi:hypothetical protein
MINILECFAVKKKEVIYNYPMINPVVLQIRKLRRKKAKR